MAGLIPAVCQQVVRSPTDHRAGCSRALRVIPVYPFQPCHDAAPSQQQAHWYCGTDQRLIICQSASVTATDLASEVDEAFMESMNQVRQSQLLDWR